ncbi:MAG: HD domain-containing protein [Nitrosomonadales bacterium]|nr:HD domain-containing protein [Nitrosomonadales bacterium]
MKIRPSQLDHIVSQTTQGIIGQFLVILLMTLLLQKPGFPEKTLYIWCVCGVALLIHRYINFRPYYRHISGKDIRHVRSRIRRYTVNVLLMGVLWAFLFAQIILHAPRELHYFAIAVAYGFAGAAIATLGTIFRVYLSFVFPMLGTLIAAFYFQSPSTDIVVALIMLLGLGYLLYTAYEYSSNFQLMHERTDRLRETEMEALVCLGKAGEYRDAETSNHVLRVGYAAYLLARSAGFPEPEAETLMYASPLHDLGKIGIPDSILLKPGKLTDEEQYVMKNHTRIGAEILKHSQSGVMKLAKVVALSHHEKWDGSGFPDGLSGEAIPIEGRIVAICDVFDALVSCRPYKKCWSDAEAIDYLRQNAGKHFDPRLVELFVQNIPKVKAFSHRLEDHESATGLHPIIQLM